MKFPKIRNYNRIKKELSIIIIFISIYTTSLAQTILQPQPPPAIPEAQALPAKKVKITPKKRTAPIRRIPTNDAANTRDFEIDPKTTKAIQIEEQQRIAKEEEIALDLKKSTVIKRTFGSSLFNSATFDPTSYVNIATPNNYILGTGDKLNMDIYGYSQYKQVATVNADGFIVLEKAGVVNVAGLSIEEAEKKIRAAFSKVFIGLNNGDGYSANTFLKVSLSGFRSLKIKITGEVIAPGAYTVTSFTSLLNALYACGGPNDIGSYRDIKLIRNNRIVSSLDLYEIVTKGYSKGDFLLKDQDVIHVGPYMSRIAIDGFVKRKGLFELLPNESLTDVIAYAGGFDQYAYTDRIKIYRNTSRERKILDVKNNEFRSLKISNGDSIVVEKLLERYENIVSIEGAVFRPGEYSLDSSPTLQTLINAAEGLKEESLQGRIAVIRTNEDLSISSISVNLAEVKKGLVKDLPLKRLDRVIIPSIFDLTEASFIKIQGAINNPEATTGVEVPFIKDMSIQDLLVRVGGLTEAASLSKIEIVRRKRNIEPNQSDAQISEIIEFEINPDLSVDSKKAGIILQPYDEVFVRTSPNYEKQNFATIKGEVFYPGKYGIKYKDEKVSDLIKRSGGLNSQSYVKGATLVRKTLLTDFQRTQREEVLSNLKLNIKVKDVTVEQTDDEFVDITEEKVNKNLITESIGIDLEKIMKSPGSVDDIILQDGDEINIPIRLQTVRIEGEVLYPTTVKFKPDLKFTDYVSRSGGYTKKSAASRSFVIYPNGSVDRTRKFLFVKIHPKIEPGSEIIIPAKTENTAGQLTKVQAIVTTLGYTLTGVVSIIGLLQLNKK
jgi:protein involved in polysaccharide export with SLBB domain